MKKRILNEKLAAIIASIRHGEMLFIADARSGTASQTLYPLKPNVEYLDLATVTGSPSFQDIVSTLVEVGDFEGAIVTDIMPDINEEDYNFLTNLLGKDNIHQIPYVLDYYQMRDRCKAVVQTGDYDMHAQAILIAGSSTDTELLDWLKNGIKSDEII